MENWRSYINEDLSSSIFLKVRENAELDILSYYTMPARSELDGPMLQRHMNLSKHPTLVELRDYLVYGGPSAKTSGMSYKEFRNKLVPEKFAQQLAAKVGLDLDAVKAAHDPGGTAGQKWPLPGLDLTGYMIYWMIDSGTLTIKGKKYAPTPRGAKRFYELMDKRGKDLPDTIQGGEDAKFRPSKPLPSRKFDPSRFKE